MTEYILKSSAALSVAYLLYFLFLRKYNNFKWLRLYFLGAIIVSFLFPALKYLPDLHRKNLVVVPAEYIPAWIDDQPNVSTDIIHEPFTATKVQTPHVSLSEIIKYAYLTGILFFLLRFIIGLSQLAMLAIKYRIRKAGTDRIVVVKNLSCPFSFFHLIFINRHDLSDARRGAMLQHEREHVRQWHSLDLLLLEFVTMVQWFNPFAWLIRRSLKEIHEYLADEGTINEQFSMLEYQQLLISQACGLKFYLPANGFNSSLTKKRILMITNKKRNRKWSIIIMILIITIVIVDSMTRIGIIRASSYEIKPIISKALEIVYPNSPKRAEHVTALSSGNDKAQASPDTVKPINKNCIVKYDTVSSPTKNDSMHRTIIAKSNSGSYGYDISISSPPLFNGTTCIEESQKAFDKFVKENLKYPEELVNSIDAHRTGTVIVSFKIGKDGKVQDVKCYNDEMRKYYKDADEKYKDKPGKLAQIKRDMNLYTDNPLLVKEAIRVISLQKNYIPAKSKDGQAIETESTRTIHFWNPKDREQNMSYRDYIKENLKYPQDAIDRKVEGTVILKYDLNKDGHYGNIKLGNDDMRNYYTKKGMLEDTKDITDDPSLVKEAIRLLKERPGYYIENFDTTMRVAAGMCNIDFRLPKTSTK